MAYFLKKIHKIIFFLPLIISINLYTVTSNALPAPLSKEQLLKQSDIIAKVKVIGVTKIGDVKNAIKYQAWLKILKPIKGYVIVNDTIIVTWHKFDKKLIGSWAIDYYPDEELITYLIWDRDEKSYKNISWNSVDKIQSSGKKLPKNDGEIILYSEPSDSLKR
jgi:hypothetical protein